MAEQSKTMSSSEYDTYQLGDWELKSGKTIPGAFLAYKTYGNPKSPAIVIPTCYGGRIIDNEYLIGSGKPLDPEKHFVIVPALFGNGESVSPSNTNFSHSFPRVTYYDNVRAQHQLVTEHFGIQKLFAVLGFSMGAGQTYQWITQYPDMVQLAAPICGSARTSLHNQVFLEGVKSALLAVKGISSAGSQAGGVGEEEQKREWSAEERRVGLKALGRVYAGWGLSQAWYRERTFERVGHADLESYLQSQWDDFGFHPEDLLTKLWTWQAGDCSAQTPYDGDLDRALGAIRTRTLVVPSRTDLYFPPEDSQAEVERMAPGVGTLDVLPSIWGHVAGGGANKTDTEWLSKKLIQFFNSRAQGDDATPKLA